MRLKGRFVTWLVPVATTRAEASPSGDRKSTRLNSSHGYISYAVFCLKKKIVDPHERLGGLRAANHFDPALVARDLGCIFLHIPASALCSADFYCPFAPPCLQQSLDTG